MSNQEPMPFTLRGAQLLAEGTTTDPLAVGEGMWLHAKVYWSRARGALTVNALGEEALQEVAVLLPPSML